MKQSTIDQITDLINELKNEVDPNHRHGGTMKKRHKKYRRTDTNPRNVKVFKGKARELQGGELLGHNARPELMHPGDRITAIETIDPETGRETYWYWYDPKLRIDGQHYEWTYLTTFNDYGWERV